jgi:hypothetical protein
MRGLVHLEGMGLLGCLTAWQLSRLGIEFTWSDCDASYTAWRACTGACYPCSPGIEGNCYYQWMQWVGSGIYPDGLLEVCDYWVDSCTKSLPHGLVGDVEALAGPMRLVGRSVHLNAQRLVELTRSYFACCRTTNVPAVRDTRLYLIAHGFNSRLKRYLWGWNRLVKLSYDPEGPLGTQSRQGCRPCFYLRKNRFQYSYCYPRPGTPYWYAGSSMISQTTPRMLNVEARYAAWLGWFKELSGGLVEVEEEGDCSQGWRPLGQKEKNLLKHLEICTVSPGRISCPPMGASGFRLYPCIWEQLSRHLSAAAITRTLPVV